MKKRIIAGILLLIVSITLLTTSNANCTIDMNIEGNTNVTVGENMIYKITLNEPIVACNFDIEYDSTILEFVQSETTNLSAAVNNGKVSCMYVDISNQGTSEFKIKFKALKENTDGTSVGITNVKFRAKDKSTSYIANDIQGVNKKTQIITVAKPEQKPDPVDPDQNEPEQKPNPVDPDQNEPEQKPDPINPDQNKPEQKPDPVDPDQNKPEQKPDPINPDQGGTQQKPDTNKPNGSNSGQSGTTTKPNTIKDETKSKTPLPNTGIKETTGYFLMAISLLLIFTGIMKLKSDKLDKIFKAGGVMAFVLTLISGMILSNTTYAATFSNVQVKFYNNLIENKNISLIIVNQTIGTSVRQITKQEVMNLNNNITDITTKEGTILNTNDKVKTTDIIKTTANDYVAILYGDSNCDGIMCDTDDIMSIVQDYLGKEKLQGEKKLAANLQNTDNVLDTDDVMQMVNTYLGRAANIVSSIPQGDHPIVPAVTKRLNFKFWLKSFTDGTNYSDGEVKLFGVTESYDNPIIGTTDENGYVEFNVDFQAIPGETKRILGWIRPRFLGVGFNQNSSEFEFKIVLNDAGAITDVISIDQHGGPKTFDSESVTVEYGSAN